MISSTFVSLPLDPFVTASQPLLIECCIDTAISQAPCKFLYGVNYRSLIFLKCVTNLGAYVITCTYHVPSNTNYTGSTYCLPMHILRIHVMFCTIQEAVRQRSEPV